MKIQVKKDKNESVTKFKINKQRNNEKTIYYSNTTKTLKLGCKQF